jgi:hypothetical protein
MATSQAQPGEDSPPQTYKRSQQTSHHCSLILIYPARSRRNSGGFLVNPTFFSITFTGNTDKKVLKRKLTPKAKAIKVLTSSHKIQEDFFFSALFSKVLENSFFTGIFISIIHFVLNAGE